MASYGNAFESGIRAGLSAREWDRNRKAIRRSKGGQLVDTATEALKNNQVEAAKAAGGTNRGTTGVDTGLSDSPSIADLYRQQYDLAEKRRKNRLDATIQANNQAADKSLNDAYIAYMIRQRNLPQQLRANGINGGATETTLGDLNNTYMNNRYNIMSERDNANAQARLAYDDGLAGDYDKYLTNQISLAMSNNGGTSRTGTTSGTRTRSSAPSGTTAQKTNTVSQNNTVSNTPSFNGNGYGYAVDTGITRGMNDAVVAKIQQLLAQGYTYDQIRRMLGY